MLPSPRLAPPRRPVERGKEVHTVLGDLHSPQKVGGWMFFVGITAKTPILAPEFGIQFYILNLIASFLTRDVRPVRRVC